MAVFARCAAIDHFAGDITAVRQEALTDNTPKPVYIALAALQNLIRDKPCHCSSCSGAIRIARLWCIKPPDANADVLTADPEGITVNDPGDAPLEVGSRVRRRTGLRIGYCGLIALGEQADQSSAVSDHDDEQKNPDDQGTPTQGTFGAF